MKHMKSACIITAAAFLTAAGICGIQAAADAGFSMTAAEETVVERGDLRFTVYDDFAIVTKCLSQNGAVIPDTIEGVPVTEIGNEAFAVCNQMKEVVIPGSVETIGDNAFGHNMLLESVTIGNGTVTIGNYAFDSCPKLKSVTLPDTLFTIGDRAFYQCTALSEINFPENLAGIGDGAFWGTAIQSADLYAVSIQNGAFENCTALKTVKLQDAYTVPDFAFSGCEALESVTLSSRLEAIGTRAFDGCKALKSLTVPARVEKIGSYAFNGCDALTLKVAADSAAEKHAQRFAIKYEVIDAMETGGLMTGDLNGDCRVSVEDVQLALQAYTNVLAKKDSGLNALQYEAASSVCLFGGSLTVEDVQFILRYYTENEVAKRTVSWDDLRIIYMPETTTATALATTAAWNGTCIGDELERSTRTTANHVAVTEPAATLPPGVTTTNLTAISAAPAGTKTTATTAK